MLSDGDNIIDDAGGRKDDDEDGGPDNSTAFNSQAVMVA